MLKKESTSHPVPRWWSSESKKIGLSHERFTDPSGVLSSSSPRTVPTVARRDAAGWGRMNHGLMGAHIRRNEGRVKGALVKVVQQHRQQAAVFRVSGQAASQPDKAFHPLGLQTVSVAQVRLEQDADAVRHHSLDIFIFGQRSLFQWDTKLLREAQQNRFLHTIDQCD